jgi:hypothetical protein
MGETHLFITKRFKDYKQLLLVESKEWLIEPQILDRSTIRIHISPVQSRIRRHPHISLKNARLTIKSRLIDVEI